MLSRIGLAGKVAIIIGAGGIGGEGIGPSTCSLLAEAGANLVAVDVDQSRAQAVAEEIRRTGGRARPVVADVRQSEQVAEIVSVSLAEFGRIDVLVNIVGGSVFLPAMDIAEDVWDAQMVLNLKYVLLCSRAVAAAMIKQGRKGSIISIASVSGITAAPHHSAYGAAKAGLIGLTRSLAVEWAPHAIRVNAIAPGSINTPRNLAHRQERGIEDRMKKATPLGRIGEPTDVAGAVLWLASDLADYVTGQTIVVDGGRLLNQLTFHMKEGEHKT